MELLQTPQMIIPNGTDNNECDATDNALSQSPWI